MELKEFIELNNLTFNEGERNTNVTILCGFAIYQNNTIEDCKNAISNKFVSAELFQEIERVFDYANKADYGSYWRTEDAKNRYKFN